MDGLVAVFRRRFLLVLVPLVLAAVALWAVLAAQDPTWTASASVRSGENAALADAVGETGLTDLVEFARPRVADGVAVSRDGTMVRFEAEAGSATGAERRVAEAVATVRTARLELVRADADAALAVLESDVARAYRLLTDAQEEAAATGRPAGTAGVRAAAAQAEVERRSSALAEARDRYDRALLVAEADEAAVRAERLVDEPGPAVEQAGTAPMGLGVLFGCLGVAAAVALVELAERRDETIRNEVDAQEAIPGIPILAVVEGT